MEPVCALLKAFKVPYPIIGLNDYPKITHFFGKVAR